MCCRCDIATQVLSHSPQVVDLTGETRRLATGLSEAHLRCDERQRDEFLYYLLVCLSETARFGSQTANTGCSNTTRRCFDSCDERQRDEILYYLLVRP